MISIRHCIVFICLQPVLCSTAAYAAEDEFSDLPVVFSDDTLEQAPSRAPVAISSIDRDLIEASGARTIPEVLRLIPGIVVGHSVNDFGDKPLLVAAYHGHSDQYSKQMNVLIDGRSIYDPLLGGVNWYNIPIVIDDIERIEVTRGPNASTYGSNSFMAVINIITRHAAEDQGHFARVNAGNHDIFDATYRYGGNNGDLDYRVTLATVNDDGQDRADGANANDDVSSGLIDYRLDFQINTKNQLTYTGSYGRTEQQAEQTLRPETEIKKPQREIQDTNAHQLLRWDSTINKEQSFIVKYFFNYLKEEDAYDTLEIDPTAFDPLLDPFSLSIDASYKSQRHNLEFTHFIDPVEELHLVRDMIEEEVHAAGRLLEVAIGTLIELPRAALIAGDLALESDFFSFGTNDLTQTTMGISRDDAEEAFLRTYVEHGLMPVNPFQRIDTGGVGKLIESAIIAGRAANPGLEIGVCGEHGGDPDSIAFCRAAGFDYVSCSPYRVPVARLASASRPTSTTSGRRRRRRRASPSCSTSPV